MNTPIYEEEFKNLSIKIFQDEYAESPEHWEDSVFIVANHRDFYVEDKNKLSATESAREYQETHHVFALEAYIHSGIHISIVNTVNYPDRQFDVSAIGYVFVDRKESPNVDHARIIANGHLKTWNDYLSGNVYGYVIEDKNGNCIDSCFGFYGDYDDEDGALANAQSYINAITNNGKTDCNGQYLFAFAN